MLRTAEERTGMQPPPGVSGYNLDQWKGFMAILEAMERMDAAVLQSLRDQARSYLRFREELDAFQNLHTAAHCGRVCYETGLSACCGFESIFTFFADQVVTLLVSREVDVSALVRVLGKPNRTRNCVYLGPAGCLWNVRPISCAMFFCDEVKASILDAEPTVREQWEEFRKREKEFTWPDKRVLFDDLERHFMQWGADTPFMYFHKSPGLLRVKARAGLVESGLDAKLMGQPRGE